MKRPESRTRYLLRLRLDACAAILLVAVLFSGLAVAAAPVRLVEQAPVAITNVAPGTVLVDFGRVAFGNLILLPPANATGQVTVHFGEAFSNGRINRHPPGSVRYAVARATLDGSPSLRIAPAPNARNTKQPAAVLTPPEWGVVLPFRWVEIENWPGELRPEQIRRRAAFATDWDEQASRFECSEPILNQVWDLCRYSIKATTFAGVYVDGDRERIAYEADAYLAQLGRFSADGDAQMARDTFDRLMAHPTWPTEWAPHMIFMAYEDWMQTGDTNWLAPRYAGLKEKLQLGRARADGLLGSNEAQLKNDVVDWPTGERDGYVFTSVNTVVNAFHLRALKLMAELARALGHPSDAQDFADRERAARAAFQEKLFDPARGLYRDGEGTDHCSLHANLFPMAFDLVPAQQRAHIAEWLGERGMRCSVYAAQYLLEGLFENNEADKALALMVAPGDRSWRHMVESGTTITWEAWDQHYKPNQDWNHSWGAAPANLLPRYVLGLRPLSPGGSKILIQPQLGGTLTAAEGVIPTARGRVSMKASNSPTGFALEVSIPDKVAATVMLPTKGGSQIAATMDGKPASGTASDGWLTLEDVRPGKHIFRLSRQ